LESTWQPDPSVDRFEMIPRRKEPSQRNYRKSGMRQISATGRRWNISTGRLSLLRAALLLAGLLTYLVSPDDVVWRLIKSSPSARLLEHVLFGFAALLLGLSLLLELQAGDRMECRDIDGSWLVRAALARLLQAIGIGSLLPLPGFLILVCGDLGATLLMSWRGSAPVALTSRIATSRSFDNLFSI
jgi:hypothetical protein